MKQFYVEEFERRKFGDPAVQFVFDGFCGSDNEHFDGDRAMAAYEQFAAKSESGDVDCVAALLRERIEFDRQRLWNARAGSAAASVIQGLESSIEVKEDHARRQREEFASVKHEALELEASLD